MKMDVPLCWGKHDPVKERCSCKDYRQQLPCGLYFYRDSRVKQVLYHIRWVVHNIGVGENAE